MRVKWKTKVQTSARQKYYFNCQGVQELKKTKPRGCCSYPRMEGIGHSTSRSSSLLIEQKEIGKNKQTHPNEDSVWFPLPPDIDDIDKN